MSESSKTIDARGLACPQPVILTKRALEEAWAADSPAVLEVLVDGPTARENVSRFAAHEGHQVAIEDRPEGASLVRIMVKTGNPDPGKSQGVATQTGLADQANFIPEALKKSVLFISSDKIGMGNDELGQLLMKGFLRTISESEDLPIRIIFMNSGVKLALDDSPALASLKALGEKGVEILACGTCLDFFQVRERLAVGRISNMLEISASLLGGRVVSL